jgi:hypothetical protein
MLFKDPFPSTSSVLNVPQAAKSLTACMAKSPAPATPAACPISAAGDVATTFTELSTHFNKQWLTTTPAAGDVSPAQQAQIKASSPAIDVLNHDLQTKINQLFNAVYYQKPPHQGQTGDVALTPATVDQQVDISVAKLDEFLSLLQDSAATGSWDALSSAANNSGDVPPENKRQVSYVSQYLRAYFRNGKFFSVTVNAQQVKQNLTSKLSEASPLLSQSDAQSLANQLFSDAHLTDGKLTLGTVGDVGFVTRGGQALKFPALQAEVTLPAAAVTRPSINYTSVGSDLLRVYLHAIFDAKMGVPAVSNSTGVASGMPEYKEDPDKHGTTTDQFALIEARSNEVESWSAAAVGRLVRGAGWLSLNNEAVATIIETLVGVTLRKETEKVMWCWYECAATAASQGGDFQGRDYNVPARKVTVHVIGREEFTKRAEKPPTTP